MTARQHGDEQLLYDLLLPDHLLCDLELDMLPGGGQALEQSDVRVPDRMGCRGCAGTCDARVVRTCGVDRGVVTAQRGSSCVARAATGMGLQDAVESTGWGSSGRAHARARGRGGPERRVMRDRQGSANVH